MALIACGKLNFSPAKNGIGCRFSQWQIVSQKALDHEHNCECQFGSFVQDHDAKTPCNTVAERAADSVCLGTTEDDAQGGHESSNLNTKRCHTQGQVTLTPAPNGIMKKAEPLAATDDMQSLEFVTHLITGVNSLLQQKQDQEDQDEDDNKDQDYKCNP